MKEGSVMYLPKWGRVHYGTYRKLDQYLIEISEEN